LLVEIRSDVPFYFSPSATYSVPAGEVAVGVSFPWSPPRDSIARRTGGPLKPAFGLSGDVQMSPTLSSRPEQIIAKAMICGVEGPCVFLGRGTR